MSFNLNANIDFNKTVVPLKRCDHTGVAVKYDIEISCTWTMHPMHYPKLSMSMLQVCVHVFWKMHSFSVNMVRRRISEGQRWQIIGMWSTGISFKAIGRQMGYHYTVVNTRKSTPWKICQDLGNHMSRRSVKTVHCNVWSDGCHWQPALLWKQTNGYQIDVCQQEQ